MTDHTGLDDAFQARHLAVSIERAVSVEPDEPVAVARARLSEGRFDQAPVMWDGVPVGFVLIRRLEALGEAGRVRDAMVRAGSGNLVSADASVGRLLEWIIEPGFLFVLEGKDITGFITVSDFNKQPARGYLYLLLARLETGLAELIRRRFEADQREALARLPEDGQAVVRDRYAADQALGKEGELVAYFDFSDLVCVIKEDDELRRQVGARSKNAWSNRVGGLVRLRNDVMHPVRNLVLAKGGLMELQEREQRIRQLLERVDLALQDDRQ